MEVDFGLVGADHVLREDIVVELSGIEALQLRELLLEFLDLVLQVGHLGAQSLVLVAELVGGGVVGSAGELLFQLAVEGLGFVLRLRAGMIVGLDTRPRNCLVEHLARATHISHADEFRRGHGHVESRLVLHEDKVVRHPCDGAATHSVEELDLVAYTKCCHSPKLFIRIINLLEGSYYIHAIIPTQMISCYVQFLTLLRGYS